MIEDLVFSTADYLNIERQEIPVYVLAAVGTGWLAWKLMRWITIAATIGAGVFAVRWVI